MNSNNSEDTCTTKQALLQSDKLTIMESPLKKYIRGSTKLGANTVPNKRILNPQTATSGNDELEDSGDDDFEKLKITLREQLEVCLEKYKQQKSTIQRLEHELEIQQGKVNELRHDNQTLRKMAVDITATAEQEEEYISNKLLRHISGLKKEKSELLIQVEQEEEYLMNMLQRKLQQLQKEKVDLENMLEQEQEYIVNSLQKQLESLRRQQISPRLAESELLNTATAATTMSTSASSSTTTASSTPITPVVPKKSSSVNTSNATMSLQQHPYYPLPPNEPLSPGSTTGLVEMLKAEIRTLKAKATEMEREYLNKQQQCSKYRLELIHYRKQHNLSVDDMDDGRLPRVFRSHQTASCSSQSYFSQQPSTQSRRSESSSSQRSVAAGSTLPISKSVENSAYTTVNNATLEQSHYHVYAPMHYSPHSTVLPQSIPGSSTSRSPSVSSSSASSSLQRRGDTASSRRVSGSLFGLVATPPQHPPQL